MKVRKQDLAERFRALSHHALLDRVHAGTLTPLALGIAIDELRSRGIEAVAGPLVTDQQEPSADPDPDPERRSRHGRALGFSCESGCRRLANQPIAVLRIRVSRAPGDRLLSLLLVDEATACITPVTRDLASSRPYMPTATVWPAS